MALLRNQFSVASQRASTHPAKSANERCERRHLDGEQRGSTLAAKAEPAGLTWPSGTDRIAGPAVIDRKRRCRVGRDRSRCRANAGGCGEAVETNAIAPDHHHDLIAAHAKSSDDTPSRARPLQRP